jgi:hypothetical protein
MWNGLRYKIPAGLTLLIAFAALVSNAQYFSLGTDPASVKWEQLKTSGFRIIYPSELAGQAQYLANALEHAYAPACQTLEASPGRIPVILHNRTTVSNAFAPYAPNRIELLTTPPQDNYAQDWLDQLVLHEFRHAVQYASLDRGLTKALTFIMGQQAIPAVLGLFVPMWFIEGDATIAETAMSLSGRGRDPAFLQGLRAQWLERDIYSYDKAVHGSFRDYTPDRYELGYHIVGKTSELFGTETWTRALHKTGSVPVMLVPFSHTLHQQTGSGKGKLYHQVAAVLKEEWQREDSLLVPTPFRKVSPTVQEYIAYRHPVIFRDSLILAEKDPIRDISRVVVIDRLGRECRLFYTGTGFVPDEISARDSMICWTERASDPRWGQRDYAVIRTFNIKSREFRQLTRKTRYFAPVYSHDGQKIAVSEMDELGRHFLVILDATTGAVIRKITTAGNLHFIDPCWTDRDRQVLSIVQADQWMSVANIRPETEEVKLLLPPSAILIGDPLMAGDYLIHTGAYTGINNIFAYDTASGELFQVTNSRFGARRAMLSDGADSLVYEEYTPDGAAIVKTSFDPGSWSVFEDTRPVPFPLATALSAQENFLFNRDSIRFQPYNTKPYRKGFHLFNPHSWAPLSIDADNATANPGLVILSQNLLSSSVTELGYSYNMNEMTGKYYLSFNYEGLYPAINLIADYGLRRGNAFTEENDTIPLKWNELNLGASVYLPLNWNKGCWYRGVRPEAGSTFKLRDMDDSVPSESTHDRVSTLDYSFYFYNQFKSAAQDIYPRWGQYFQVNYSHTPSHDLGNNFILAAQGVIYFPGLFLNHGIRVYGGYQYQEDGFDFFGDLIILPRGHSGISMSHAVSLSAGYAMPLFYPDWRLGPVLYIKRFKASVFYDQAFNTKDPGNQNDNTIGLDLTANFHLLSFLAPIESGIRTMYLPGEKDIRFQFLLTLDFDSL